MVKYLKCLIRKHQLEVISNSPSSTVFFLYNLLNLKHDTHSSPCWSPTTNSCLKSSPVGTAFGAVTRWHTDPTDTTTGQSVPKLRSGSYDAGEREGCGRALFSLSSSKQTTRKKNPRGKKPQNNNKKQERHRGLQLPGNNTPFVQDLQEKLVFTLNKRA